MRYKCNRCSKTADYRSQIKCSRCDYTEAENAGIPQYYASPQISEVTDSGFSAVTASHSWNGGGGESGGGGASASWSDSCSSSSYDSGSSDSGSCGGGE